MLALETGFSVTRFGFEFISIDVGFTLPVLSCGCVLAVAEYGQGVFA